MVICLERDAGLHMAQLMPMLLTVSCFSKIQIGFTFLVPADPGSSAKRCPERPLLSGYLRTRVWVVTIVTSETSVIAKTNKLNLRMTTSVSIISR